MHQRGALLAMQLLLACTLSAASSTRAADPPSPHGCALSAVRGVRRWEGGATLLHAVVHSSEEKSCAAPHGHKLNATRTAALEAELRTHLLRCAPTGKGPGSAHMVEADDAPGFAFWQILLAVVGVACLTTFVVLYCFMLYRARHSPAFAGLAKWGSLIIIVLQTCFGGVVARYNRTSSCLADPFSVMALHSELLKLGLCLVAAAVTAPTLSLEGTKDAISTHLLSKDTLKLAVPSLCYVVMNNLRLVTAAHLSVVMMGLLERSRLLTTAMMMVCILGRTLNARQVLALVLVVVGLVFASDHMEHLPFEAGAGDEEKAGVDLIGVVGALTVAFLSAFANVYIEKILKSDETSLIVRNLQFCSFSIPLQLITIMAMGDWHAITGIGFCATSWAVVIDVAFAGLLISVVLRFADNNLKGLAQTMAVILTVIISIPFFGFEPTIHFYIGATLVIGASYLYVHADSADDGVAVLAGGGDAKAGGDAKVVVELLRASHHAVSAIYDDSLEKGQLKRTLNNMLARPLYELPSGMKSIVALGTSMARKEMDLRFPGRQWITAVHPSAVVDETATLGPGSVVMAGAIIQANARIGRHVIVSTGSSVDHDCAVGDYATIAPRATVCGRVTIGEGACIDAGATVMAGRSVAAGCTLGAGATLDKDMPAEDETWHGVPAKFAKRESRAEAHGRETSITVSPENKWIGWVWPKHFDSDIFLKHLQKSIQTGQFTNHGPAAKVLEAEAVRRFGLKKHVAIAVASGTAALHAMVGTHIMRGRSTSGGILVSAFGFPPILQNNWTDLVRVTDIDAEHGGPILPEAHEHPPAAVCIVNPFGYIVDVAYYRAYCDRMGIPLWMDNASTPYHIMPDGRLLSELGDMVGISLHETKAIGRGEGGLLLVLKEHEAIARRAVNFGYDSALPPPQRIHHTAASNWRMGDFQAAAVLMEWELGFEKVVQWCLDHDEEVVDMGPFRRGKKGTIMACVLEPRQPRPNHEIKHYYVPLATREKVPECWRLFDMWQARPFHP